MSKTFAYCATSVVHWRVQLLSSFSVCQVNSSTAQLTRDLESSRVEDGDPGVGSDEGPPVLVPPDDRRGITLSLAGQHGHLLQLQGLVLRAHDDHRRRSLVLVCGSR